MQLRKQPGEAAFFCFLLKDYYPKTYLEMNSFTGLKTKKGPEHLRTFLYS